MYSLWKPSVGSDKARRRRPTAGWSLPIISLSSVTSIYLLIILLICNLIGRIPVATAYTLPAANYHEANNAITVVVGGLTIYPAHVAFNNTIERVGAANQNLMLPPPNNSQLCEYPTEAIRIATESLRLENNDSSNHDNLNISNISYLIPDGSSTTGEITNRQVMPVTLLLSNNGSCSPRQQASVALALQRDFTLFGIVERLIIYRAPLQQQPVDLLDEYEDQTPQPIVSPVDPDSSSGEQPRDDSIHTLMTSWPTDHDTMAHQFDDDELKEIGVVFVDGQFGMSIRDAIEEEASLIGGDPHFLQQDENWFFAVSFIEPTPAHFQGEDFDDDFDYNDNYHEPPDGFPGVRPQNNGEGGRQPESDDFYWFRLVVFCVLVVSPCFRAAYLWYAGGARIRFRYNEQGRIIGLQYIPPMPFWFAPRQDETYNQTASRMTREEVMALPEIIYHCQEQLPPHSPPQSTASTDDTSADNTEPHSQQARPGEAPSRPLEAEGESGESGHLTESDSSANANANDAPIEENTFETQTARYRPEMSTTCSICIDDFEDGERLRMLPRCRHIFHTECLLPWLVERHGSCPLCKTEVIEPENDEDGAGEESSDDDESAFFGFHRRPRQRSEVPRDDENDEEQQRPSRTELELSLATEQQQQTPITGSTSSRRSEPEFELPPSVDLERDGNDSQHQFEA